MKRKNTKKIGFTTRVALGFLKETAKNLFDVGVKIMLDPDKLIKDAGFYVKYPSLPTLFDKWVSKLENNSSFKLVNNKIYLTDKGRIKIIKNIITEKGGEERWDGKWRAVVFDIPESSRKERRFLRNELKWMKFKELQKSIWVCPYNIEKELFALLKLWKIDFKGDIRFLRIDKITEDKDIIKYFNL